MLEYGNLFQISEEKNNPTSVTWLGNYQKDYLIFLNINIYYIKVYNLIFDEILQIWKFTIFVNITIINGSKLSVDILYENIGSTATCYSHNNELECTVDHEPQNKTGLVTLNHIKSEYSSITWIDLFNNEGIDLVTYLTFVRADNLRINEDNFWVFDIPYFLVLQSSAIPAFQKNRQ